MKIVTRVALGACVALGAITPASASHRWGNYHWQKGSGPLTVEVGDNVDSKWDAYLPQAMDGGPYSNPPGGTGEGWNDTTTIESPIRAGRSNPRNCKAVAGTIQVCNSRYGQNGWLGIAQIWLSGGHISQGVTKLNDTYFDTAKYNTPAWRRLVMCQEIGHDYGLGHTNEVFTNYNDGTCMDYTNAPSGGVLNGFDYGPSNEYINAHDKAELASIYNHAELASTNFGVREVGKAAAPSQASFSDNGIGGNSPAAWGRAIGRDGQGRPDVFMLDLGNGQRRITHVFWAEGEGPKGGPHHHD